MKAKFVSLEVFGTNVMLQGDGRKGEIEMRKSIM